MVQCEVDSSGWQRPFHAEFMVALELQTGGLSKQVHQRRAGGSWGVEGGGGWLGGQGGACPYRPGGRFKDQQRSEERSMFQGPLAILLTLAASEPSIERPEVEV